MKKTDVTKYKTVTKKKTLFTSTFLMLFSFVLFLWFIISFARVAFNFSKIFTQDIPWLSVPYENQREIIYSDNEVLFRKIQYLSTNKSTVYLITQDYEPYFLLRYLLYPEQVYLVNTVKNIHTYTSNELLLYYHEQAPLLPKTFHQVAVVKSSGLSSELFNL